MNTVIDLPELCPRIVSDQAEIDRLRWFQQNRYFEGGLLDEPPTMLEPDPSMALSTYFGVYAGEDILATARIVRATSGLPMLDHHTLYPTVERLIQDESGSVAEISRLAVGNSTPHYRALTLLAREFLRFGLRNQHATYLIASVEKPMVRILNRMLGVPLQIIGPTIDKYGSFNGATVPIMIDTVECLANFQRQQSRRWEFFVEGLVIDLTSSQSASLPICERLERVAS